MNKLFNGALCAGIFSLGLAASVEAAPIHISRVALNAYDVINNQLVGGQIVPTDFNSTSDGSTASSNLSGQLSRSGIDTNGDPATLTLTYDGASEVSAGGVLKSRSSLTLENGFSNDLNVQFSTDPNGVPDQFRFDSTAVLTDTLSLQGDANLSSIVVDFNLEGELSRINQLSTRAGVGVFQDGNIPLFTSGLTLGQVDETIQTNPLQIVNGMADLSLTLNTVSSQSLSFLDNPAQIANGVPVLGSSANFFNTLRIGSIAGFDANGNAVDLISATDSTGFQFSTVRVGTNNVPEPGTLALFFMGLAGFGFMRYRKYN